MPYLDTRELAERKRELELQDELDEDEQRELGELETLESDINEFHTGETLIPVDEFEEYAMESAEEFEGSDNFYRWPYNCIDWERAANELRHDYTEVDYDGNSYLVRSY